VSRHLKVEAVLKPVVMNLFAGIVSGRVEHSVIPSVLGLLEK